MGHREGTLDREGNGREGIGRKGIGREGGLGKDSLKGVVLLGSVRCLLHLLPCGVVLLLVLLLCGAVLLLLQLLQVPLPHIELLRVRRLQNIECLPVVLQSIECRPVVLLPFELLRLLQVLLLLPLHLLPLLQLLLLLLLLPVLLAE